MLNEIELIELYKMISRPLRYSGKPLKVSIMQRYQDEAKMNFTKLNEPKTQSLENYISTYVAFRFIEFIAKKQAYPISIGDDSASDYGRALNKFYSMIPVGLAGKFGLHKLDKPHSEREAILTFLIKDLNIDLTEAEKRYKDLIGAKIRFSELKNKLSPFEYALNRDGITTKQYDFFRENVDSVIRLINSKVPNQDKLPKDFYGYLNQPCYICKIDSFPPLNKKLTQDLVMDHSPLLRKHINKVIYQHGDMGSMHYDVRKDNFIIKLFQGDNGRHQSTDALHELCHVANYLELFERGINPYLTTRLETEKSAMEMTFKILKGLSSNLYDAFLGRYLLILRDLLFAVEVYENSQRDLGELYAKVTNRCFVDSEERKTDFTFLFNEQVLNRPFSSLKHGVALVEILTSTSS